MWVNLKAGRLLLSQFCKHGFEQNRAEEKVKRKGKHASTVGWNFPEKHAMHLKSYLQCIISLSTDLFFFSFFKCNQLKLRHLMSTLTDRQKDRCVHNVPPHGVADTDNVQIGQQTKTLQDFFFYYYIKHLSYTSR